jgi:hypothetical protein
MVKRVVNDEGKRLTTVRVTETVPQIVHKPVGDDKPKGIFVGRVYTGVARSKPYPYRSKKRGAPDFVPIPRLTRAVKAMKSAIFKDRS